MYMIIVRNRRTNALTRTRTYTAQTPQDALRQWKRGMTKENLSIFIPHFVFALDSNERIVHRVKVHEEITFDVVS